MSETKLERVCICGHAESEHLQYHTTYRGRPSCPDSDETGFLDGFRPVIEWPDCTGFWWMKLRRAVEVVECRKRGKQFRIQYRGAAIDQYDFKTYYGSARFTQCLEPSPFPSPLTQE